MRNFSARETEWLLELDGIELAGFWRRALAFLLDWILILIVLVTVVGGSMFLYFKVREMNGHPPPWQGKDNMTFTVLPGKIKVDSRDGQGSKDDDLEIPHLISDILVPVLYFGLLTWKGKGRTPGKRLFKIRVVSIAHRHLSFWHSVERALGYGAAFLEGGFGFIQYFIHPYRRCAQDRLAETIVVTERSYQAMQHKLAHALLPDGGDQSPGRISDELLPPDPAPISATSANLE